MVGLFGHLSTALFDPLGLTVHCDILAHEWAQKNVAILRDSAEKGTQMALIKEALSHPMELEQCMD